jgi:hypothetical protein
MDKPPLTEPFEGASQRRAHGRRALFCPAKLMLTGKRIVDLRIVNISAGGLGTVADDNLLVGTTCEVRFDLPQRPRGQTTLYLRAVVMNSIFSSREGGFKLGLMFVKVPDDSAGCIATYVQGEV